MISWLALRQLFLQSHPAATMFSLCTNASNIPKVITLPSKAPATGHSLWCGHCRCLEIKDSTSADRNLCKYTWENVVYIVLTGKRCLRLDILPKISQQTKSIENMIRITWNTEVMQWQKANRKPNCPFAPTSKEAKHVHILLFCD